MVRMEIYDESAGGQAADGSWPTKMIFISKDWLDAYARSETKYDSAEALLANYTLDEVEGIEAKARAATLSFLKNVRPAARTTAVTAASSVQDSEETL